MVALTLKQFICRHSLLLVFLIITSCSKDDNYLVREVVITFDDAPSFPEHTSKILDILQKHGIKATFFCIGQSLIQYPDLANRIATEQFMGNHTFTHINVENSDLIRIYKQEILQTQFIIDSLQPDNKHYFRPPFSKLSLKQKLTLLSNGFDVVMWDLSAEEWDNTVSTVNIVDYFHKNLYSKAKIPIIQFHLTNSTVEALDILLPEFKEKNIRVITLDEFRNR
jgi:peptidoglycan/xylan/chitin deacetylase (PgdA/CDA1 family)